MTEDQFKRLLELNNATFFGHRQVVKGSKAKEIIRPIFAKPCPEDGEAEPTL